MRAQHVWEALRNEHGEDRAVPIWRSADRAWYVCRIVEESLVYPVALPRRFVRNFGHEGMRVFCLVMADEPNYPWVYFAQESDSIFPTKAFHWEFENQPMLERTLAESPEERNSARLRERYEVVLSFLLDAVGPQICYQPVARQRLGLPYIARDEDIEQVLEKDREYVRGGTVPAEIWVGRASRLSGPQGYEDYLRLSSSWLSSIVAGLGRSNDISVIGIDLVDTLRHAPSNASPRFPSSRTYRLETDMPLGPISHYVRLTPTPDYDAIAHFQVSLTNKHLIDGDHSKGSTHLEALVNVGFLVRESQFDWWLAQKHPKAVPGEFLLPVETFDLLGEESPIWWHPGRLWDYAVELEEP